MEEEEPRSPGRQRRTASQVRAPERSQQHRESPGESGRDLVGTLGGSRTEPRRGRQAGLDTSTGPGTVLISTVQPGKPPNSQGIGQRTQEVRDN